MASCRLPNRAVAGVCPPVSLFRKPMARATMGPSLGLLGTRFMTSKCYMFDIYPFQRLAARRFSRNFHVTSLCSRRLQEHPPQRASPAPPQVPPHENSSRYDHLPVMSEDERQFNIVQWERRYRRVKRVSWSVVSVFVVIFVLEVSNLAKEAKEIKEKKEFGSGSFSASIETTAKASVEPGSGTLTSLFSMQRLSYRVADFPPDIQNPASVAPFVTSMFAHGGLIHLLVNSYGFFQLSRALMMSPVGIPGTLGSFLVGGVMASQISCAVEKAYANGEYKETFKLLKRIPKDPDPQRTLNTNHLGASSGLMAMMAILTLRFPYSQWSFPMINLPVPAFVFAGLGLGWDIWAFYENSSDGIGHTGHLGGWISGAIIYFVFLRGRRGFPSSMKR